MEESKEAAKSISGKVLAWLTMAATLLPLLTAALGSAVTYYSTKGENVVLTNENKRLREDLNDQRQMLQAEREEANKTREARDLAEKELSQSRGELARGGDQRNLISTQSQQLLECQARINDFQSNRDDIAYISGLQTELDQINRSISFKVGGVGEENASIVKELQTRRDALQARIMDAQSRLRYVGAAKQATLAL